MLQEVNGSVFLPDNFTEHKSLTQISVIPFSKIFTAFAKLNETKETDPQLLIVDFLVHMEFCREIAEEYLLQLVTETQGQPQQQDLVKTRVEVLVQTLQGPAAVVLVGLGLSQVSGRTLLCQCVEKKVLLTAVLCVNTAKLWKLTMW